MKFKIETSARHIHLSFEDFYKLFEKKELTFRNDLSQKGEFASDETLEIVGPNGSIKNVRVLGPFRKSSQLEISRSDSFKLGVDAPLALSGEGLGEKIKIIGPKSDLILPVAMVAKRHLHVSTLTARKLNLKNSMNVSMRIGGPRSVVFNEIVVRISDDFCDSLHLDTDEANACGAAYDMMAELIIDGK